MEVQLWIFKWVRVWGKGIFFSLSFFLFFFWQRVVLLEWFSTLENFFGFHVSEDIHFKLLQFVNDTIVLCDGLEKIFEVWRGILRGFELVSSKTKIIGLNIKDDLCKMLLLFSLVILELLCSLFLALGMS